MCKGLVAQVIHEKASAAGSGLVALLGGGRLRSDSVIVATGTCFEPVTLPGVRKDGVFVLDAAEKYGELGRACASLGAHPLAPASP